MKLSTSPFYKQGADACNAGHRDVKSSLSRKRCDLGKVPCSSIAASIKALPNRCVQPHLRVNVPAQYS